MKIFKFFIYFLIVCAYGYLSSTNTYASEIIFQEDFSGDFNKWKDERNNINLWSISDGKAKVNVNTYQTITEISPKHEFWPSESESYEYSLDYTPLAGADRNISFGFKDINNWYEFHFIHNFSAVKIVNRRIAWSKTGNYYLVNGQTYRIKVIKTPIRIQFFVNDNKILDETNNIFADSGRISLKVGTGSIAPTKVEFDNILVRTIDNAQTLPVPSYKQTDSRWANQEYDSATSWSPATPFMSDWGCAVTSVAMIMNFHGINKLPNGTDLTPETLNNWLKSQADGYVYGGLVNWLAISRLTKLIADEHSTQKLEYSRSNGSDKTKAFQEIEANKPVMLEIAGHFLVGKGKHNDDLVINDPYYNYSQFAEHNKPLLSTRMFQPSNTDLSGIIMATTGTQTANLLLNDAPVGDASYTQESLQSPVTGTTSPVVSIVEYMKPSQGMYSVALNTTNPYSPFTVNLHVYNIDGSVQSKILNGVSDSNGHVTLRFNFDGTSEVIIRKDSDFSRFIFDLNTLFETSHIQKKYVLLGLTSYVEFAQLASPEIQLRYIQFLAELITLHERHFSAEGKTYLLQELNEIKHNIEQSA